MEFQLSYFKSYKMMLWKCCTQYASIFGKFSSGHRTGKGQFSFQSQRKAIPKNAQTTAQLHSSHTLVGRRQWQPTPVLLPGGLPSIGSHRVGHDWINLAAAAAHASKVILKILQARLQQYMNCKLPDVKAGFRKGRGTRDQIASICWIIEKAKEFQKKIYFCFIDYAKAFDCVDHNKVWKILQEMGIPDHLTCHLRNQDQEATVRTGHGTTD